MGFRRGHCHPRARAAFKSAAPPPPSKLGELLSLEKERIFAGLEAVEAKGVVAARQFYAARCSYDDGIQRASIHWQRSRLQRQRRAECRMVRPPLVGAHSPPHLRRFAPSNSAGPTDRFYSIPGPLASFSAGKQWHGRAGLRKRWRNCKVTKWRLAYGNGEFCRRVAMNTSRVGWTNFRCRENWPGADCVRRERCRRWPRLRRPHPGGTHRPADAGKSSMAIAARSYLGRVALPRRRCGGVGIVAATWGVVPTRIMSLTGLLSAQLDEALHELAALGLATADAFTAVRVISGNRHRTAAYGKAPPCTPIAPRVQCSPLRPMVVVFPESHRDRRRASTGQLGLAVVAPLGSGIP